MRSKIAGLNILLVVLILAPGALAQPHGELVGWNVARFYASEEAALRTRHSLSFFQQPQRTDDLPDDFAFEPTWARTDDQTAITIDIPEGASLYGLGRAPGRLLRANTRFMNDDASPWILGLRPDGLAFGVILDTTWAATFDIQPGRITIETGDPDPSLIIIDRQAPADVALTLAGMTGRMEIPPLWALGIHTSAAAAPDHAWIEAAWLSCDLAVPDPAHDCLDTDTADAIADAAQRRMVRGPFSITRDAAGPLEELAPPPIWVQDQAGKPLEVNGRLIPDFTHPGTRAWWGRQIAALADVGAAGIAAHPHALVKDIPDSAWLAGDPELGGPGPAAQYRGIFGLLAAQATWELFEPEVRDRRALISVPTAALGAQRWTVHLIEAGTRQAPTPRHLIAAALNSSLTAHPVVGASLPDPASMSQDEWQSWLAAAALLPLLHLSSLPEAQPEAVDAESKAQGDHLAALASLRMQLLPYLYTLTFHNFFQGDLILRPLFLHDPTDPALRAVDTAFLLGRDLLVIPPLGDDTFRHEEHFRDWHPLHIGDPDPRLPALYMRPGAIIPLAPPGERTTDWTLNPLTVVIALGGDGQAHGYLYEDEWDNYGLFRGQTRRLTYHARQQDDMIMVRLQSMDGGWGIPHRRLNIRVLTESGELQGHGSERGTIRIPLEPQPGGD